MKTNIIINRLKDLRDKGECVSETIVLEQAIKSIEALEKIREDMQEQYKTFANISSISDVWADAIEIVDKHLKEIEVSE